MGNFLACKVFHQLDLPLSVSKKCLFSFTILTVRFDLIELPTKFYPFNQWCKTAGLRGSAIIFLSLNPREYAFLYGKNNKCYDVVRPHDTFCRGGDYILVSNCIQSIHNDNKLHSKPYEISLW